jgi:hypothetical protein
VVPLYFVGVAVYGTAGAVYAASVTQKLPALWLGSAAGAVFVGALIAIAYWRSPTRAKGAALIATQLVVLASNAISRQWVQVSEIMKWYDPFAAPVRGEWGSLALFMAMFLAATLIISWIGLTALRRTRSRPA